MRSSGADRAATASRLVLDTSAYSHLRRKDVRLLDLLTAATSILLPIVVLGELYGAFAHGGRRRQNVSSLDEFLAEPFVSILPLTQDVARRYGDLFAELRRTGTPISTNDLWIAAATLDCGGHLVTFDRDFDRIPHLPRTVLAPA